ncbi:EIICBA-Mtl [Kluyvera cryocrescens]|uniref:protein-N(pi)-phosphohistidine--D-mannitol phosphotransferase n=1 Tax=Kluyvera cryocrescens TaxID=580 RepID=A0A485CMP1_KLUCR|nr:EIICBA-Mtl [Kluyvera cryocrescens]
MKRATVWSEATRRMQALKQQSKSGGKTSGEQPQPAPALDLSKDLQHVRKIIVACDAGMGSSALGAGVLRKKVKDAGLAHISVTNCAINSLPDDVDLVITHQDLTERAMRHAPQAMHISLSNFLDSGLYTDLTTRLLAAKMHRQPTIIGLLIRRLLQQMTKPSKALNAMRICLSSAPTISS